MTHDSDRPQPRTPAEVEKFLQDLEEDQADRRELENDDDLKRTDRTPNPGGNPSSPND